MKTKNSQTKTYFLLALSVYLIFQFLFYHFRKNIFLIVSEIRKNNEPDFLKETLSPYPGFPIGAFGNDTQPFNVGSQN
jgi:hypothetical protein